MVEKKHAPLTSKPVAAATAHPAWTASTAARKLVPAGSDFDAPPVLAPKAVPNYLGWLPRTPRKKAVGNGR
eukprot:scaffold107074_cov75-Phaeocystis_antarctica.AAC.1